MKNLQLHNYTSTEILYWSKNLDGYTAIVFK